MELTQENYYTNKASWHYLSVSNYKDFMECEAAALAKLNDEWEPTQSPIALLVGSYVHSYFESKEEHEKFKQENKKEMFSSRSPYGLKKDFQIAQQMIKRLEKEDMFMNLYEGEKEKIVTGNIYGVDWKAKIDCLNVEEGYFVDIKTNKDLHERRYDPRYNERTTFVERFGYALQMAVYKELLEQTYDKEFVPIIAGVSKQTPSEARLIALDEDKMQFEMVELKRNIDHIQKVRMGEEKPEMCGKCEYCREYQRINGFTSMDEL